MHDHRQSDPSLVWRRLMFCRPWAPILIRFSMRPLKWSVFGWMNPQKRGVRCPVEIGRCSLNTVPLNLLLSADMSLPLPPSSVLTPPWAPQVHCVVGVVLSRLEARCLQWRTLEATAWRLDALPVNIYVGCATTVGFLGVGYESICPAQLSSSIIL